jgi:hypothetical protein
MLELFYKVLIIIKLFSAVVISDMTNLKQVILRIGLVE